MSAALLTGLFFTLALPARAQTHLDNPFVGARLYVNPDYTAEAQASAAAAADPALAAAMVTAGAQPTAIWLDRAALVPTMATHLDRALAAGSDLLVFVLDDLPGRGCDAALSTEFQLTSAGLDGYRTQFVDVAADIARQPRYAGLRIVFVVEPDGLPHLITGMSPPCVVGDGPYIYMQAVQYAVNTLHALPNAYLYLDLAEAGWLGWDTNASAMISLLGRVAEGFTEGKDTLDGFATNVRAYVPIEEPFIPAGLTIAGQPVRSSRFFDWNPQFDDADYAADMYARLVAAGWPGDIGVITDTSRNGWGGPARPSAPSASATLETFVNASRVDRRAHRGLWCNQAGAGIGLLPQAAPAGFPASHYDAYLWVKPPGQSDGPSLNAYDGPRYDRMCDPDYQTPYGVPTGALPGAPPKGRWSPEQFAQLVQNAWPPLGVVPVVYTLGVARGGVGAGTVTSRPAGIQCGATCSATFAAGTAVTLTATPAAGSTFSRWTGACTDTGPVCVVTLDGERAVTAVFGDPPPSYTLSVTKAGAGSGAVTSSPAGISCGATCSATYASTTTVTLTAVAASGSVFGGWTGCTATGDTCTAAMSAAREVVARFDLPSTPCTGAITFSYGTGGFGTTRAACYRTSQRVNGWGCSSFEGRTVRLNGGAAAVACGAGPFPLPRAPDGYTYFSVSAGQWPWASLYTW